MVIGTEGLAQAEHDAGNVVFHRVAHRKTDGEADNPGCTQNARQQCRCAHDIQRHNQAVNWACLNREIIAKRFLGALGLGGSRVLDITHNSVTPHQGGWLHRKGAAPSDKGAVVIPGSRGTHSYLVMPSAGNADISLRSLAHGAGRRWKRSDAKARLSHRYSVTDLTRTPLGGRVICEDKSLMYEEAPEAYKDISTVITDMERFGLVKTIATLRPLITYKTRRR